MTIISAVYNSLKRKKSAEVEARRLGITLPQYLKIRSVLLKVIHKVGDKVDSTIIKLAEDELNSMYTVKSEKALLEALAVLETTSKKEDVKHFEIHEDLETGVSKISAISSVEPKSPEEIIKLLKIDTSKWKLSQYWNKEKSDKWLVSALVTKRPESEQIQNTFLELIQSYELPKPAAPEMYYVNSGVSEQVCAVISLQDLHFGKTGNEDLATHVTKAIEYLISKAHVNYTLQKVIFVIGADTLNMDTFDGTTTKGTPVENSATATNAYLAAFDSLSKALSHIYNYTEELEVVFIPGNHDRLSSFHLLHALKQMFQSWSRMTFNIEYAERKVLMYGKNMICFEHGDVSAKNNPLVFAVEFPQEWGASVHRLLYTGHYHGRKTKEYVTENEENGFVSRIIPALTSSDYYHYHNKWIGNKRAAILHIHDADNGLIGEFTYSV
jgi:hypothetical protein